MKMKHSMSSKRKKTELVNNELIELLELENEVNILEIQFKDLEKLGDLSLAAMQSLSD